MSKKTLRVTVLLLCVIAVLAASFFAVTRTRFFVRCKRDSYIRQLCREHSIPLHIASVSEKENGEPGYDLYFISDGGISDSSVSSAIALYDIIGSDECKDSFLQDNPVTISVYAVDTPDGGFSMSSGDAGDDTAKKLVSFSGSIKDMFGTGVLTPIKEDLEYISITDARSIKKDDFKDYISLKKIRLIDCKDETGKNTYEKSDKEGFIFYNDDVDFDIMKTCQ